MLEPIRHLLDNFHIILASSSPRRSELLTNLGLKFDVIPSHFEEDLDPKSFPNYGNFAAETAHQKVLDISRRIPPDVSRPQLIVGADTIVTLDGKMFGKPKNQDEAFNYLSELNNRTHTVYTGVALKSAELEMKFHTCANVSMAKLSEEVIKAYINTGEPIEGIRTAWVWLRG
ncbi:probable bifunctional dTTP/UTP pyrophosphatase/methyltransferase protein isoform X2 [Nilaparvata lugens]|uniref:probable bifunctional dTTP/UTP pyrophosphatase/methyltransferase protein isoform X2 n=1 Tax=Nilaparvata lugens TaxID=108931 RepID=UPI00193CB759|nr:probable bifunctional dTTP/UTP pyrophosphatase/methyltransferase protein isoform X2 [Nilaparvata lugens]